MNKLNFRYIKPQKSCVAFRTVSGKSLSSIVVTDRVKVCYTAIDEIRKYVVVMSFHYRQTLQFSVTVTAMGSKEE